jgi:hypothetical protein
MVAVPANRKHETQPPEAERGQARGAASRRALGWSAVILALEILLLFAFQNGLLNQWQALIGHACIVVVTVLLIWQAYRQGSDTNPFLLLAITTGVIGPLGAAGCLVVSQLVHLGTESDDLLKAWYARLSLSTETDAMTRLSDTITTGRALHLTEEPTASFLAVLEHGSVSDQQRVLGIIARKFHPDYLPVLKKALTNEAPVIRVQAAAVAAHVRNAVTAYVRQALDAASLPHNAPADGLRAVRDVRLCIQSGLLDERDRTRAARLVSGLEARCFASIDSSGPGLARLDVPALDAYEDFLLRSGRLSDFRRTRSRFRRRMFGRYTLRRTPRPARVLNEQSPHILSAEAKRERR